MRFEVRRRMEMGARVRSFDRAHPSTDPEYAKVFGRFEERGARAELVAARQYDGQVAARNAQARRVELRNVVHFQLLRYLVAIGGIAAKTRTELAERFRLPDSHGPNAAFLAAVKSMLTLAEAHRDALVSEGMSPRLLDDLGRMVAEFEAALDAARTARLEHMGARAELETVTAEIVELVNALDGINRWRFGNDPELLVEWNAARFVPGVAKTRVTPPAAGEGQAPSTSGGAAPAA